MKSKKKVNGIRDGRGKIHFQHVRQDENGNLFDKKGNLIKRGSEKEATTNGAGKGSTPVKSRCLTPDDRLGLALRYYFANFTGPHPGGMPAQPSKYACTVEESGIVVLRNSYYVLAKLRVNDDGRVEELDFDAYEEKESAPFEGNSFDDVQNKAGLTKAAEYLGFAEANSSIGYLDSDTVPSVVFWACAAQNLAMLANENFHPSRRGVWAVEGMPDIHVLYNNNPYRDKSKREQQTARIREAMKKMSVEELAYGRYPSIDAPDGAGYSYAMIVRADEQKVQILADAIHKIVAEDEPFLRART